MASEQGVPVRGKILVVDDNPVIQRAVYFALRDHGYKVLMTGEIYQGIKIIRDDQPDLILLDLSFPMDATNIGGPVPDGFFFMEWVRRTPEFEKIPIMVISGMKPELYKDRVAAAGVDLCFQKPFDKEVLLQAIQQTLDKKKPEAPPRPA